MGFVKILLNRPISVEIELKDIPVIFNDLG